MSTPLKRMFWDIESSPNVGLFWRAGYRLSIPPENIIRERAIICICWKWEGHKRVHALTWDKGDDRKMLEEFLKHANDADEMCAHNGDRFDVKWFNARCLIHDLGAPPERKTVDTLKIAKAKFYLNSNRLDYLSNLLLGEGKSETDFDMWRDILLDNCPVALKRMVDYCKRDVKLLERVYARISAYVPAKTHAGVMLGGSKWTCVYCASSKVKKNKTRVTAKGTVQHQMQCRDCGRYYSISNLCHQNYLEAQANTT